MANQEELRRTITDQIVDSLKSGGIPPWRRPWGISPNSGFPTNVRLETAVQRGQRAVAQNGGDDSPTYQQILGDLQPVA